MPALFVFLLKVNVALILFCAGYFLVLRRLTFYTLNRVYLAIAIVFSSVYPFINLNSFAERHQEIARPVQTVMLAWEAPVKPIVERADYWQWAQIAFWVGVCLFAARLAFQLLSLYRLYRSSKPGKVHDHEVRLVKADISPFSFWQSIYINPDNLNPADLKSVLQHEDIHIKEWHTLDILLTEISVIFYWFNPGVWLMKKAVRENIEFITDRKVLQQGIDSKNYQYSLLNVSFASTSPTGIANHFNLSTLKKRIIMMNAKRSSKANLTRYAFLIPAVVVLLLVFSFTKAELAKKNAKAIVKASVSTPITPIIKNNNLLRSQLITDTPKRADFNFGTTTSNKIDITEYHAVPKYIQIEGVSLPISIIERKDQPDSKKIVNTVNRIDTSKYRRVTKAIPSANGKTADTISYYELKENPGKLTFTGGRSIIGSGKTKSIYNLTSTKQTGDTSKKYSWNGQTLTLAKNAASADKNLGTVGTTITLTKDGTALVKNTWILTEQEQLSLFGKPKTADKNITGSTSSKKAGYTNLTFSKNASDTGKKYRLNAIIVQGTSFRRTDTFKTANGKTITLKNGLTEPWHNKNNTIEVQPDGTLKQGGKTLYMANGEKAVYKKIENVKEIPAGALKRTGQTAPVGNAGNEIRIDEPLERNYKGTSLTTPGKNTVNEIRIDEPVKITNTALNVIGVRVNGKYMTPLNRDILFKDKLIIVNGKENVDINTIPADKIESIQFKDINKKDATKYGDKAKNGVVIITTKK